MRSVMATASAVVCCALSVTASAQVELYGGPETTIEEARTVVAMAPQRTTLWLSWGVRGTGGSVVAVLPVGAGDQVDPGDSAWLAALDSVTRPRLVAPSSASQDCGGLELMEDTLSAPPSVPLGKLVEARRVSTDDELAEVLYRAGVPADVTRPSLADGALRLAVTLELNEGHGYTRPIRWIAPRRWAPLSLRTRSALTALPHTLWVISDGSLRLQGREMRKSSQLDLTWLTSQGTSNYRARLEEHLAGTPGVNWDLLLFSGAVPWTAEQTVTPTVKVPSLVDTYLNGAEPGGPYAARTAALPADCGERIHAALERPSKVGVACAEGRWATLPTPDGASSGGLDCDIAATEGELHPDALRCGGADEIALALSGLSSQPYLSRHLVREEGMVALDVDWVPANTDPLEVRVSVGRADGSRCGPVEAGASLPWTGPDVGIPLEIIAPPEETGASDTRYAPSPPVQVAVPMVILDTQSSDSESCSGSTADNSNSDSSCSGSSEDSDSGCGSSNQDSGSDGCGGSTESDDDDYDGEDCGGGSGGSSGDDSGYDGETCGGGSGGSSGDDSDYDGETCGGGSSGSSSSDCSISRRPRRLRLSWLAFGAAAILLPLRRVGRRRRRFP